MPTIKQMTFGLALATGFLFCGQALADRAPTPAERSQIESALRKEGFTRWGEIEFDDGMWEVDNAYASDGRKYDLKLHRDTFAIVRREPD